MSEHNTNKRRRFLCPSCSIDNGTGRSRPVLGQIVQHRSAGRTTSPSANFQLLLRPPEVGNSASLGTGHLRPMATKTGLDSLLREPVYYRPAYQFTHLPGATSRRGRHLGKSDRHRIWRTVYLPRTAWHEQYGGIDMSFTLMHKSSEYLSACPRQPCRETNLVPSFPRQPYGLAP